MGLFTFTKTPVPPDATGPYRSGAVTLKVFCWVAMIWGFVIAGVLLLVGLMFLLISAVGAAFMEAFLDQVPLPFGEWGMLAGAVGVVVMIFLVIAAAIALGIWLGATAWAGWIYQRWLARDPRALTQALVLGIIMAAFAGISLLTSGFAAVVDPSTLILGIFGVLLIVFASNRDVKAMFQVAAAPTAPTPQ